eukprot:TRINITY_DN4352_c0_g1_i4.p1 TRINITY_DN4352_c0_g1~~TRINITY_DN4352_c0_g1_i4.p1  ORF type:complete len:221 (-),score=55.53 TRINITY_DN4352_c0_g1_i4:225-887(-)
MCIRDSTSTPLTSIIPMKIGKLSDALGLVDSIASMGAILHSDLDICTQAAMDILRSMSTAANGDNTSPLDSQFALRFRKIIAASNKHGSSSQNAPSTLDKDQEHSDDDGVGSVDGSEWSFEASSMSSSTCDLSNPDGGDATTNTIVEHLAGVTTYRDLCGTCASTATTTEGVVVAKAVRSLVEEAVGNARFVLRVDICHDTAVYKEASRAVLRCNPKDAS